MVETSDVRLKLTRAGLERIYQQAVDEHPAECCGILTADARAASSAVHPCANIQERLHAEDPDQYPRQPRTAYFIDRQEQFNIISAAERGGGRVSGFYHSHIDCDAYFSEEDAERAMAWGDEPAYADAAYLVVSVYGDGVRGHRAFEWKPDSRSFVEVQVEILE